MEQEVAGQEDWSLPEDMQHDHSHQVASQSLYHVMAVWLETIASALSSSPLRGGYLEMNLMIMCYVIVRLYSDRWAGVGKCYASKAAEIRHQGVANTYTPCDQFDALLATVSMPSLRKLTWHPRHDVPERHLR